MRMATLLEEVRKKEEGFASDAQRRAAFASGYKEKDKKKEEVTEKFSSGMIDKLRKAYEPLKGKKIPPAPLMKIFDKIDSNKEGLIQLYKADIPFVSMMAMSRLMLKHDMKADDINKLGKIRKEEFELDEEISINELKMNDPKLNKIFDKLKPKSTVQIKTSSSIAKGQDFKTYLVMNKNTLRNGTEKITLKNRANPAGVKSFLYKRDGKITFAIGDMGASIDDIKEMAYKPGSFKDTRPQEKTAKAFDKYIKTGGLDQEDFEKARKLYVQTSDVSSRKKLRNFIQNLDTAPMETVMDIIGRNDPDTFEKMYPDAKSGEFLSKISFRHRKIKNEEVELDEMDMKYVLINMQGKVQGYASDKKDALDIARRTKSTMHPIKKKISDKTLEKMNALSKTPKELADLGIIDMEMSIKKKLNMGEEVELGERYDLYHKDFSSAMQHAYSYAKQKLGITIDPKEIDSKVATGPKKPTEGKTNKYRLKGKGGNLQIQVYNKGGSKPFELNMYKEGTDPSVSLYADQITLNAIKEK